MIAIINLAGQTIIFTGILIIWFGVYTVLRLDGFYARAVVTSKVEAMGFALVAIGSLLLTGFTIVSLKIIIILLFELLTVSTSTHAITRSAWISGYRIRTVTDTPPLDKGTSDD